MSSWAGKTKFSWDGLELLLFLESNPAYFKTKQDKCAQKVREKKDSKCSSWSLVLIFICNFAAGKTQAKHMDLSDTLSPGIRLFMMLLLAAFLVVGSQQFC